MESLKLESNNDINQIQRFIDLIRDEYGNYYYATELTTQGGKLIKVRLSHTYFEDSFSTTYFREHDENPEEFKFIGETLRDGLVGAIKRLEDSNRKIFSIQDLIDNGIQVSTLNLTKIHPRENKR
ncbi:hypothetical protein NSA31_06360 [Bacillus subtilis]|uniref:hypothetical protein n=1 Tax=Bacillus subtilis TaxID=1423 RepID=UPI002149F9BE|nr:hypothetical protein [Bacillus subtilis]MCR1991406.1 hypothetical protein [Bacillus subtilis]